MLLPWKEQPTKHSDHAIASRPIGIRKKSAKLITPTPWRASLCLRRTPTDLRRLAYLLWRRARGVVTWRGRLLRRTADFDLSLQHGQPLNLQGGARVGRRKHLLQAVDVVCH